MDMQNAKELEIPEGRVRTIHDKDSRLIWGRLAYDTKYAGDTFQQTYSGKNLFDKSMSPIVNSGGANTVTETDTGIRITMDVTSGYAFRGWVVGKVADYLNQTLTLSANVSKSASGVGPRIHLAYCDSSGGNRKVISYDTGTGEKSCSGQITTSDADGREYILVVLYGSEKTGASVGDYSQYDDAQLEIGSSPTSYEPYTGGIPAPNPDYPQDIDVVTGEQTVTISDGVSSQSYPISLGSTELCKIGDYQDKIFNNDPNEDWYDPDLEDNAWYVHKEVVKISPNGTEEWKTTSSQPPTGQFYVYTTDFDSIVKTKWYSGLVGDNFTMWGGTPSWLTPTTIVNGAVFSNSDASGAAALRIMFPSSIVSSVETAKTWFALNLPVFYYPIATPTDTKITDATLISQLEAIHEWLTRYGYASTVTGNLPLIVNRTNL